METTPNLGLPLLEVGQAQKELTVNEALCALDALQAGVKSRALSVPPASPAEGACYIVGPSPSGVWSGLANHLAYYLSGWRFLIPKSGMHLWVADEAASLHYNGNAWMAESANASATPARNALLNGHFHFWQRGTSFAASGYGADRWSHDFSSGAGTLSRQPFTPGQTAVEGEPAFFLRMAQNSGGSAPFLSQKIEGLRGLAGRNVTLSLSLRAAAAFSLTPSLTLQYGSGGSPSANLAVGGTAIAVGTNWTRITQSFTLPSLSGKTLGANGDDCLQLKLALPAGTSFTLDLAQAQLEIGAAATPFAAQPYAAELAACQRYYEPLRAYVAGYANAAGQVVACTIPWKVEKRATPSIVTLATLITPTNATALGLDQLSSSGARYTLTAFGAGHCTAGGLYGVEAEL